MRKNSRLRFSTKLAKHATKKYLFPQIPHPYFVLNKIVKNGNNIYVKFCGLYAANFEGGRIV